METWKHGRHATYAYREGSKKSKRILNWATEQFIKTLRYQLTVHPTEAASLADQDPLTGTKALLTRVNCLL